MLICRTGTTYGMAEKISVKQPSPSKYVCEQFRNEFKHINKLKKAFINLTAKQDNALILLQITSCNAVAGYGISFTSASCETELYLTELFPFGSIFVPGVELLSNYLIDDKYIPEGYADRVILARLLKFLLNTDELSKIKKLDSVPQFAPKESDWAVVLVRHFLSRLSSTDDYTLDQHSHIRIRSCVCGDCTDNMDSYYGDTSIGALNAWHGSLDVVFGNPSLFVTVMEEDGDTSPGGRVESLTFDTSRTKSQLLAKAIVFSFIQKKRHPEFDHFLIPCIGITRHQIIFIFYDSSNDLLLEGPRHDLVLVDGSVNYEAVIAVWLVMNYKFYCSGPTSSMLNAPKSNFYKHAKEQLELYENDLEFRNVSKVSEQFGKTSEKVRKLDAVFVWPDDIDEINPAKKFKTGSS